MPSRIWSRKKPGPTRRMRTTFAGTEPAYVQYAAITTEIQTGATLALIGGRNYSHSRFDRTRSSRDLGSAFEPFVAAAAAERGKLVLPGKPVQTGRQIGPAEVQRIAKRCGISRALPRKPKISSAARFPPPRRKCPSASPPSATRADARNPTSSAKSAMPPAKSSTPPSPHLTQALSPSAALDAASVLRRKNGTRTFTGATGSERDAWTLRLGPSGATAIWIGFDKPTAIAREPRLKSLLDEFVKRLGNE